MNQITPQTPASTRPDSAPRSHSARPAVPPAQPDKLIRIKTVCELTGLGKTSVYSIPEFPKRVVLSRRAVGWKLSEVQAWIASRSTVGA
jgi:prophage regulatory protein